MSGSFGEMAGLEVRFPFAPQQPPENEKTRWSLIRVSPRNGAASGLYRLISGSVVTSVFLHAVEYVVNSFSTFCRTTLPATTCESRRQDIPQWLVLHPSRFASVRVPNVSMLPA